MIRIHTSNPEYSPLGERLSGLLAGVIARRAPELLEEGGYSLDLFLMDDAEITQLNRRHKNCEHATDVLAFADGEIDPDDQVIHFGDVAVSVETAEREAQARNLQLIEEIMLYALHGVLHLLGFLDSTDEERAAMREAEREELAPLGITPHWNSGEL
ncbi:MAG: rRNA maturation RNase YbeY [Planctomycetes bacterium]|nr:rRNA maturation RNase YbeY [Planctomycetota bacterium]